MSAPVLRQVLRGTEPDELLLVDTDGKAIILRGYGLTPDERLRMREAAFLLLSGMTAEVTR